MCISTQDKKQQQQQKNLCQFTTLTYRIVYIYLQLLDLQFWSSITAHRYQSLTFKLHLLSKIPITQLTRKRYFLGQLVHVPAGKIHNDEYIWNFRSLRKKKVKQLQLVTTWSSFSWSRWRCHRELHNLACGNRPHGSSILEKSQIRLTSKVTHYTNLFIHGQSPHCPCPISTNALTAKDPRRRRREKTSFFSQLWTSAFSQQWL